MQFFLREKYALYLDLGMAIEEYNEKETKFNTTCTILNKKLLKY